VSRAGQVTLQTRHQRLGRSRRLRIDVVKAAEYGVFPWCFPRVFLAIDADNTCLISLVPGEGLEPPTNGLQNRCSTAELTRLLQ
jgi:hypothetical protein